MSSLWLPKVYDIHQLLSNLVDFNCICFNVILSSFTEILSIWHTVSFCSVFMENFVFVCRWLFSFLFASARTRKSLPTSVDYWLTETWWHRISLNWIQEIKPGVCSCDLDTKVYAHCCNLYTKCLNCSYYQIPPASAIQTLQWEAQGEPDSFEELAAKETRKTSVTHRASEHQGKPTCFSHLTWRRVFSQLAMFQGNPSVPVYALRTLHL